jgi:SAM-dependent methyltransferase
LRRNESTQENLALRTGERWRPPVFTPVSGRRGRLGAAVRRFFDIQAGSLWRELRQALPEVDGTLVDVGCGAQPYRGLLAATSTYIGLDTEDANGDFGYAIPGVRLIGADGRWPVSDAEADAVLATETLEHVADPQAFLAEAHRCLRPGGRLLLTVPFAARWHYIPHDYWRFTPSGLRLLLEQAGFSQVVVHARGNERTVACYKLLALLLPAALPQPTAGSVRLGPRALVAAAPAVVLALLANLSLRGEAGDDCLGYTVYAVRES